MDRITSNGDLRVVEERLRAGLGALGLALPMAASRGLLAYLALLVKWNRVYNLTAVRDPEAMVTLHLLDSLVVRPYVRGPRVIDVGTGPGLPGIPLALTMPDTRFVLLDSSGKKTRFVTQAVAELGLTNVEVVQARVEDFRPAAGFATVVSRAFASVPRMLAATAHLCAPDGRFLAMKGTVPHQELAELVPGFVVDEIVRLQVPGLDAERHAVLLSRR